MTQTLNINKIIEQPLDAPIEIYDNNSITCAQVYNYYWEKYFDGRMMPKQIHRENNQDDTNSDFKDIARLVTAIIYDRWSRSADVDIEPSLRKRIDAIYDASPLFIDIYSTYECSCDHNSEDNIYDDENLFADFLGECALKSIDNNYGMSHLDEDKQLLWFSHELEHGSKPMFKDSGFDYLYYKVLNNISSFFEMAMDKGIRSYVLYVDNIKRDRSVVVPFNPDEAYETLLQQDEQMSAKSKLNLQSAINEYWGENNRNTKFTLDLSRSCCVLIDADYDEISKVTQFCELLYSFEYIDESKYDSIVVITKTDGNTYEKLAKKLIDALKIPVITFASNSYNTCSVENPDELDDENFIEYIQRRIKCEYPGIFINHLITSGYRMEWRYCGQWKDSLLTKLGKYYLTKQYIEFVDRICPYDILEIYEYTMCDYEDTLSKPIEKYKEFIQYIIAAAQKDMEKLSFGNIIIDTKNLITDTNEYNNYSRIAKFYETEVFPDYKNKKQVENISALMKFYEKSGVLNNNLLTTNDFCKNKKPDTTFYHQSVENTIEQGYINGVDVMYASYAEGVPLEDVLV